MELFGKMKSFETDKTYLKVRYINWENSNGLMLLMRLT